MNKHISTLTRASVSVLVLGIAAVTPLHSSAAATVEGRRTCFTGVDYPLDPPSFTKVFTDGQKIFLLGAESSFLEEATDPRVTGLKVITWDAIFELPAMTGTMWGRSHTEHESGMGGWDGYWIGERTAFTDPDGTAHVLTKIVSAAKGSGVFEGLVVRWNVTGVDADQPGQIMTSSGNIIEASGGPNERPMHSRASGTQKLDTLPGMFLAPPPGAFGEIITWEILMENAWASHLGRSAQQGFGFIDPSTGELRGGGTWESANGDQLIWIAAGQAQDLEDPVQMTLNFAGGTGRFETALGEAEGLLNLTPTDEDSVFRFSFSTEGTIQY